MLSKWEMVDDGAEDEYVPYVYMCIYVCVRTRTSGQK